MADNKTFRVFLCSTYSDLINEREAVLQVFQHLQLLHSSMEFFGARPETPVQIVLEEVRASDIVVVIVGHRYGTLVPNKRVSYTETEYREAWYNQKPCLVYLRSDDVPILPLHIERDAFGMQALEDFKNLLQSRHLTVSYKQVGDLATHVAVDIERVLKSKRQEPALEVADSSLTLLDSLNTPSFLCDANNRILNVNKTFIKALGYPASTVIGKPLAEFIDNAGEDWWLKNSISYFPENGKRYTEQIFKNKDGHSIYYELDIVKHEQDTNTIFQCVARDVTERRQTEEARLDQLRRTVEERDIALKKYQKQQSDSEPLDKILGEAQKAYTAYQEAERGVANLYRKNEKQVNQAYWKAETEANGLFFRSLIQSLNVLDESLQKDPAASEIAIRIFKEAIGLAIRTRDEILAHAWQVREETVTQAWEIYTKIVR